MRRSLVVIHRWCGLVIALFLFVSGVTGAVISWDHELDEWLNPHLNHARAPGPALPPLELARQIELRHPLLQVTYVPLAIEEGHTLAFGVQGRADPATGKLTRPGFNQIFIDPASGEELGRRESGAVWPLSRENFVSFLYKLHYSLHIPDFWGINRWGYWLMGIIAIIWTLDCFTGFYLTLPPAKAKAKAKSAARRDPWWRRWSAAWKVRWRGGSYKLNFDLHRAGSLWTWGLLFVVAFTGFSLNLYREVFFPAMSLVSQATPSPFSQRARAPVDRPIVPALGYDSALALAQQAALQRGWDQPAGSMFYARVFGIYGVAFFHPDDEDGVGGVGPRTLYLDGNDGRILGDREPWKGTAADIFAQAQFPLHSGRILGLPGRILISMMGLVVAMLSVTGVVIWLRKRKARLPARRPQPQAAVLSR